MYTSLRIFSIISILASLVNGACAVLTAIWAWGLESVDTLSAIPLTALLGISALLFLIFSIAMWSLCGDLNAQLDNSFDEMAKLRKRVDNLEKTIK